MTEYIQRSEVLTKVAVVNLELLGPVLPERAEVGHATNGGHGHSPVSLYDERQHNERNYNEYNDSSRCYLLIGGNMAWQTYRYILRTITITTLPQNR